MKRFKFRLEKVLSYKHALTKDKERELALRLSELASAEEGVRFIMQEQDKAEFPQELTMAEMSSLGEYYEALQRALVQQRLLVLQAREAVDAAREAYRVQAIEEETLQTLKDKRKEQYREEVRKHERKVLDEIVTQRHNRPKPTDGR